MLIQSTFSIRSVTTCVCFFGAVAAQGQDCLPAADGFGCATTVCSPIPEAQCTPAVLLLDIATGAIRTEACDCLTVDQCHVEFGNATAFPIGGCPNGGTCRVFGNDTDGDGIDDRFTASCVPNGVCCLDIDDGPVAFDTCMTSDGASCLLGGGVFDPTSPACRPTQRCCFGDALGGAFCADLDPFCCTMSGGIPAGVGSDCTSVTGNACPQICGGFAGIPCAGVNEFCKLPEGNCCCDFSGLCTALPQACPDVWDPVCGCDQVTYGNECEADAAGMSIDHRGECIIGACCLSTPNTLASCAVITANQCATEGGAYQGDGTICPTDPTIPCVDVTFACCFPDGACLELTSDACIAQGGLPLDNQVCDPFFCTAQPTGACCLSDPAAAATICLVLTANQCLAEGGAYQGDDSSCPTDPNAVCGNPPCPSLCGVGQTCFDGCGRLVQGVECILFQSVNGNVFVLDNLGGFTVGDAVRVVGCVDPLCNTPCQQGGCIHNVLIEPCGNVCGGIAGVPCQSADDFCKFPEGTCGNFDLFGTCTTIPTGGCPEIYAPVCGCDGVTYPNECESDAAGVSVRHPGPCMVECAPLDDGSGCVAAAACSAIPEIMCIPTALSLDIATGAIETVACGCLDMNFCHIEFGNASPVAVGFCPEGGSCEVFSADTDGDGIDDVFRAGCVPTGVCCFISILGPLPVPVCTQTTERACFESGGNFAGNGTMCGAPEACCITFGGVSACVDTDPRCCMSFGGVPQGPGSTCDTLTNAAVCSRVCGGIAGTPCNDGEFCAFPIGTCDVADRQGVCEPLPNACPLILAPVCGCDGVTYDNKCLAEQAGASILHDGPCEVVCAATRSLANGNAGPSFCPGKSVTEEIALNPPASAFAVGVEDVPPTGWVITNITNNGNFDPTNGKVKWGPFFAPNIPAAVGYVATPPSNPLTTGCFTGTVSIDGINEATCGDGCVDQYCCPFMEADRPQATCQDCPIGDCNSCDGQACQDGRVSLCEVIGYACAWLRGCNDDLAGVTRAAFIWRNGECYCRDNTAGNWYPTTCDAPDSGCCSVSTPNGGVAGGVVDSGRAITSLRAVRAPAQRKGAEFTIPIEIKAPFGTSASALEVVLPEGWNLLTITDGGRWDETHRKIKWGPFFDNQNRTVAFSARVGIRRMGRMDRSKTAPVVLSGTVSFDGVNQSITVE